MLPRLQPPHHLPHPQPLSHQLQLQHRVHAGAPAPHIVVPPAKERTAMTPIMLKQVPLAALAHQQGRAARQPAHFLVRNPIQTLPAGIQTGRPPRTACSTCILLALKVFRKHASLGPTVCINQFDCVD